MGKSANRKYKPACTREPLFYRLRRATVAALGPLLYFMLSLMPWSEGMLGMDSAAARRELPALQYSWLPNNIGEMFSSRIFSAESAAQKPAAAKPVTKEAAAKPMEAKPREQEAAAKAPVPQKAATKPASGWSRLWNWKFPSFRKSKAYQAGRLELRLNAQTVKFAGSQSSQGSEAQQGYRSTELYIESGAGGARGAKGARGLGLHWNTERPLRLIMAGGSALEFLPLGHRQLENGFVLEFPQRLELVFRSTGENNATLDLVWPKGQTLPQKIALPLIAPQTRNQTKSAPNEGPQVRYTGAQIQVLLPQNKTGEQKGAQPQAAPQYFSALNQSRITGQGYIEIPVQYYRSLHQTTLAQATLADTANAEGHISLPLLWQAPQTERSAAHELYNIIYRTYANNLLRTMQQNLASGQIPASAYSEWLSLYLELILEPGPNPGQSPATGYPEAKEQIEALLEQNGWAAGLPLSPYLGIEREPLEAAIRADYALMDRVQRNYELAGWSFDGLTDIGNMLFRYGRLNVLRSVLQRAAIMRQSRDMDEKQRFYLLHFLWEVSQVYPRNGIVGREAAQSEFAALLRRISRTWAEAPLQSISQDLPYALDVLKDLWNDDLQLQEQAYSLALKLFELMDAQGNLGNLGNVGNLGNTDGLETTETPQNSAIPYFRAFHFMAPQLREHPKNINVVPGFWLWTTGNASASYISGQPIQISTDNFGQQGNKLLLLRGVYFYPLDVFVDGEEVLPAARMPKPKAGQGPSWYYDVGNRLLAIEIPASAQQRTALRIR